MKKFKDEILEAVTENSEAALADIFDSYDIGKDDFRKLTAAAAEIFYETFAEWAAKKNLVLDAPQMSTHEAWQEYERQTKQRMYGSQQAYNQYTSQHSINAVVTSHTGPAPYATSKLTATSFVDPVVHSITSNPAAKTNLVQFDDGSKVVLPDSEVYAMDSGAFNDLSNGTLTKNQLLKTVAQLRNKDV